MGGKRCIVPCTTKLGCYLSFVRSFFFNFILFYLPVVFSYFSLFISRLSVCNFCSLSFPHSLNKYPRLNKYFYGLISDVGRAMTNDLRIFSVRVKTYDNETSCSGAANLMLKLAIQFLTLKWPIVVFEQLLSFFFSQSYISL